MKTIFQLFKQYRVLSLLIWAGLGIFLVIKLNETHRWKEKKVIIHDVCNYYGYLPAVFIYDGDLSLKYRDTLRSDIGHQIEYIQYKDHRVFKMTAGCSYLWLPFFAGAQLYIQGYPESIHENSGYSRYNHLAVSIAALFYLLTGLLFLRSVLLRYFTDFTTALLLLMTVAGTNLYFYTIYEPGMSHVYSFFLFSVLLYFTVKWNRNRTVLNSLFLAFTLGLITVIRPTNAIAVLIPLLWDVRSVGGFIQKGMSLLREPRILMIMMAAFILPVIPQLVYWKIASGHWLLYSYNNEGFYWKQPMIWQGLFGFRKGWFIYTPLMVLGLPGIVLGIIQRRNFMPALILFFILAFYLVFAWWCWWYGGSFGMRSMIDFYPLWLLFIGVLIDTLYLKWKLSGFFFLALVVYGIHLNLFQTFQYTKGFIHFDSMTYEAYIAVWNKERFVNEELLAHPLYDPLNRIIK